MRSSKEYHIQLRKPGREDGSPVGVLTEGLDYDLHPATYKVGLETADMNHALPLTERTSSRRVC